MAGPLCAPVSVVGSSSILYTAENHSPESADGHAPVQIKVDAGDISAYIQWDNCKPPRQLDTSL